ncbi:MAG: twin-arginine translocase TatA/TatE family subunit [Cyanobacteria bacterium]|jgi:sec-independent protein translocase protein TatA|nr:twin-arginine translocase TatA/TatE family subunit [Cyanobacteria bacterium GSL.Bin1]
MLGLGWLEVSVILGVAILIFGPKKLPEMGNALGKTLKGFRNEMNAPQEEDDSEFDRKSDL